jgi:hypothetical protein
MFYPGNAIHSLVHGFRSYIISISIVSAPERCPVSQKLRQSKLFLIAVESSPLVIARETSQGAV